MRTLTMRRAQLWPNSQKEMFSLVTYGPTVPHPEFCVIVIAKCWGSQLLSSRPTQRIEARLCTGRYVWKLYAVRAFCLSRITVYNVYVYAVW